MQTQNEFIPFCCRCGKREEPGHICKTKRQRSLLVPGILGVFVGVLLIGVFDRHSEERHNRREEMRIAEGERQADQQKMQERQNAAQQFSSMSPVQHLREAKCWWMANNRKAMAHLRVIPENAPERSEAELYIQKLNQLHTVTPLSAGQIGLCPDAGPRPEGNPTRAIETCNRIGRGERYYKQGDGSWLITGGPTGGFETFVCVVEDDGTTVRSSWNANP